MEVWWISNYQLERPELWLTIALFLYTKTLFHFVSLHPGLQKGTGDIQLGVALWWIRDGPLFFWRVGLENFHMQNFFLYIRLLLEAMFWCLHHPAKHLFLLTNNLFPKHPTRVEEGNITTHRCFTHWNREKFWPHRTEAVVRVYLYLTDHSCWIK